MAETKIFTVDCWKDVKEVCAEISKGCCHIPEAPSIFLDYDGKNEDGFFVFRGFKINTDEDIHENIELQIANKNDIADVLEAIGANVRYDNGEISFETSLTGISLGGPEKKEKRFVRDYSYTYKLQKTQYRATNPYEPLICCIDHLFYYVTRTSFENAGWLASA